MNKSPIVVVGIGEMGSVFARGFMRLGYPVYPVTRDTDINALASELPDPNSFSLQLAKPHCKTH